ncbi:MAG: flagellar protein FlaG [Gammaproteobacteria bacterium]|jgi:flagellar protein FlaG
MEINVSQVGQDFAVPRESTTADSIRTNRLTETEQASAQLETKDLSESADISEIKEQVPIEVSSGQIDTAVSQLNDFVQSNSRQLNFSVDEGSNKQVVKVTDSESGEIIRQIPSEEILRISERLQDLQTEVGTAVGLLFNKQV